MSCYKIPENNCDECQENKSFEPVSWTPTIPDCTDGCEFPVFTDCVFLSEDIELCNITYQAGTQLTPFLKDVAAGLCCNCATCDAVIKTIDFELTNVNISNYITNVLDPDYALKGNKISLTIQDNSSSNDDVKYLRYNINKFDTTKILNNSQLGSSFTTNDVVCVASLINNPAQMTVEMETSRDCYESFTANISADRIDYSERIAYPYRFNAQINDVPVYPDTSFTNPLQDKGVLYFADYLVSNSVSRSKIRKLNLNTKELITIAGTTGSFSGVAYVNNAVAGDIVQYTQVGSIIMDRDEIVNGEPVLYYTTFGGAGVGGVVCRLVKENDNCCECDERKNWTNYVIGNLPNTVGSLSNNYTNPTDGTNANFGGLYGIKRWFDYNGAPSFYIYDNSNDRLIYMYYNGSNSKNDASNWSYVRVTRPSNINSITGVGYNSLNNNINIDDYLTREEGNESKRLIYTTEQGVLFFNWEGASTPTLQQSTDLTDVNWSYDVPVYKLLGAGLNHVDGTYDSTDTPNDNTINALDIPFIFKYTDSDDFYIYGHGQRTVGNNTFKSTLRKFRQTGLTTWLHSTIVNELNVAETTDIRPNIGTTTMSSPFIGKSEGFFKDLQDNIYDLTIGGVRAWTSDLSACTPFVGAENALANRLKQDWPILYQMDTQYGITIN